MKVSLKQTYSKKQNTRVKKRNTRVKKRNTRVKKLKIRGGESEHEKAAATAKAAASASAAAKAATAAKADTAAAAETAAAAAAETAAKAKAEAKAKAKTAAEAKAKAKSKAEAAAVTAEKAEAVTAVTAETAAETAEAKVAETAVAEVPPVVTAEVPTAAAAAAAAEAQASESEAAEAVQNQQFSKCDLTAQKVSKNLKQSNIKSFETGEATKAFKFTMNEYDANAKTIEQVEAATRVVSAATYMLPFVPQIVTAARVVALGFSKLQKHKELSYLSSECLSYVANISRDVAEMNSFYLLDIVTQKGISMDEALYEILQKNLFKFLYFLIDSIDFTNTELGPQQYLFWYNFLKKVDLDEGNYELPVPKNKYRYSCSECIPPELRKKLRELSYKNTGYENIVNLEEVGGATTTLERIRTLSTKKERSMYGFCSEIITNQCKNYNDTIMRLIELNLYKLIRSAYKNRNKIFPKPEKPITREAFFDYIFDNTIPQGFDENSFKKQLTQQFSSTKKEANIGFNFLMELKRIIDELNYRDYPREKKSNMSAVASSASYLASGLGAMTGSYIGSPITKYNKLLREYIIMTGNFGTMTSRYVLDFNKFDESEKKIINEDIKKKLQPVMEALETIKETAEVISNNMAKNAANMEEDSNTGTGTEIGGQTAVKGGKRSKQPTKKRRNPRKGSVFKRASKKAIVKPKSRVRERKNVKNRTKKRVKKRASGFKAKSRVRVRNKGKNKTKKRE